MHIKMIILWFRLQGSWQRFAKAFNCEFSFYFCFKYNFIYRYFSVSIIKTLFPLITSILYTYIPLLLYDPVLFLLIYLMHIRLHKPLSYHSYSLYFFTLLILKFIYIYVHYDVFIYYYYYPVWVLSLYPFIKHYTIVILS